MKEAICQCGAYLLGAGTPFVINGLNYHDRKECRKDRRDNIGATRVHRDRDPAAPARRPSKVLSGV